MGNYNERDIRYGGRLLIGGCFPKGINKNEEIVNPSRISINGSRRLVDLRSGVPRSVYRGFDQRLLIHSTIFFL